MNDERWLPGMPVLDRQAVQAAVGVTASSVGQRPRSVPEAAPTPLQRHDVLLSAPTPAIVLGAVG